MHFHFVEFPGPIADKHLSLRFWTLFRDAEAQTFVPARLPQKDKICTEKSRNHSM